MPSCSLAQSLAAHIEPCSSKAAFADFPTPEQGKNGAQALGHPESQAAHSKLVDFQQQRSLPSLSSSCWSSKAAKHACQALLDNRLNSKACLHSSHARLPHCWGLASWGPNSAALLSHASAACLPILSPSEASPPVQAQLKPCSNKAVMQGRHVTKPKC